MDQDVDKERIHQSEAWYAGTRGDFEMAQRQLRTSGAVQAVKVALPQALVSRRP